MLTQRFSLLKTIRHGDYYLITDDFDSYIGALRMVEDAYRDRDEWIKKSIRTTAKVITSWMINGDLSDNDLDGEIQFGPCDQ